VDRSHRGGALTVLSTVWSGDDAFNARVQTIDRRTLSRTGVLRAMLLATNSDVVIINGALGFSERWRDLVIACTVRAMRHEPGFVVSDATWEQRSARDESTAPVLHRVNGTFSRFLVRRLLSDRTVLCFLSRAEVKHFLADTGRPPESAVFTPFTSTIPRGELNTLLEMRSARQRESTEPYIFSGGNALRDWDLLCAALDDCGMRVRVATRHIDRHWPRNFEVGPCGQHEFLRLIARASLCVLALKSKGARSSGQQTYLNALRLGTPVIVNDTPGVRDHLADVPGAFITPINDAAAIRQRAAWLLDPANAAEVGALCQSGAEYVAENLNESRYLGRLADIADSLGARLAV
jgi:glycosyltransferase involved in cell wall biosynthesis